MSDDPLIYYASHSPATDPGDHAHLFAGLPTDIRVLAAVVRGLLFHYDEGGMYGYDVPPERVRDDEARSVREMLAKIVGLDERPLTEARPLERRLVGCCRDYSLLLTAMLRQQGVPARVRFGFSHYFGSGFDFGFDHVVTEYWDAAEDSWKLIDAQQDQQHIEANKLTFDPHDIPQQWFPTAGEVWLAARLGEVEADRYGYDREESFGFWVIQQYLLHELAALNKVEMLIGDSWGLGDIGSGHVNSPEDDALLDQVAKAIEYMEYDFERVREMYEQHASLRVLSQIASCNLLIEFRQGVDVSYLVRDASSLPKQHPR